MPKPGNDAYPFAFFDQILSMWYLPCSERFFFRYSGCSGYSIISKFQFDPESGRRRTTVDVLPSNRYLFIYVGRGKTKPVEAICNII